MSLPDVLGIPSYLADERMNYENLVVKNSSGEAYVKGLDYTIDNDTGTINWLIPVEDTPNRPDEGVGYTFYYDAFAVEGTGTYSGADTQEVSIAISDGAGKLDDGNTVSYEQLLDFGQGCGRCHLVAHASTPSVSSSDCSVNIRK